MVLNYLVVVFIYFFFELYFVQAEKVCIYLTCNTAAKQFFIKLK